MTLRWRSIYVHIDNWFILKGVKTERKGQTSHLLNITVGEFRHLEIWGKVMIFIKTRLSPVSKSPLQKRVGTGGNDWGFGYRCCIWKCILIHRTSNHITHLTATWESSAQSYPFHKQIDRLVLPCNWLAIIYTHSQHQSVEKNLDQDGRAYTVNGAYSLSRITGFQRPRDI